MAKKKLTLRKKLGFGLAFGALAALALLAVAELGLRVAGYPRGIVRSFGKLWNPDAGALPGLFRPGKHRVSYPSHLAYSVEINELGLRGPPVSSKDASVRRILCLGDSVTFGYHVDGSAAYPRQLEALLREQGAKVEVINGGCGHFSIPDELRYLREGLLQLEPDLVVLQFCSNDVTERELFRDPTLYETIRRGDASSDSWLRRTAVGEAQLLAAIAWKEWRRKRAGRDMPDFNHFEPTPEGAWDRYAADLRQLVALLRERKIPLLLTSFVDLPNAEASGPVEVEGPLRALATDLQIPYADCLPAFRAAKDKRALYLYPHDPHPSVEGNRLLAQTVADALRREKLIE